MKRVVQRTPNLGLSIRLQRLDSEPAARPLLVPPDPDPDPDPDPEPAGCDVSGVRWAELPPFVTGIGWGYAHPSVEAGPEYLSVVAVSTRASPSYTLRLIGVPLGAQVAGVLWQWSWSTAPTNGESVKADGPLLFVDIPAAAPNTGYENLLTGNAYCGTSLVGTLRLLIYSAFEF